MVERGFAYYKQNLVPAIVSTGAPRTGTDDHDMIIRESRQAYLRRNYVPGPAKPHYCSPQ